MPQVGETATAGFQVGVRRTLAIEPERAWALLTAPEGLSLWLGDVDDLRLMVGESAVTRDGTAFEFRVVRPGEQLRLRWQRCGWARPSTLQIRVIATGAVKTTISFHQEWLADAAVRAEMKAHWEAVLAEIESRARAWGSV